MSIARAFDTFKRPYTARTIKGRKLDFDRDQISAWRRDGKSWPWIARRYACNHTTVMHAAVRLGCELGPQRPQLRDRLEAATRPQPGRVWREPKPVQIREWPAGIRFEDVPNLSNRRAA